MEKLIGFAIVIGAFIAIVYIVKRICEAVGSSEEGPSGEVESKAHKRETDLMCNPYRDIGGNINNRYKNE